MGSSNARRDRSKRRYARSEQKIKGLQQTDPEVVEAVTDSRRSRGMAKIRGDTVAAFYSKPESDFARAVPFDTDGMFGADIAEMQGEKEEEVAHQNDTPPAAAVAAAPVVTDAVSKQATKGVLKVVQSWPRGVRSLLAGGISGAVSKTATAPVECIRMNVMVGKGNVIECATKTFANAGLGGFFKGNGADVLRTVPSKAIQLAAFDRFKKLMSKKNPETGKMETGPLATTASGAMAGIVSTIACFPLEMLRTRLACGDQYKGIVEAAVGIMKNEGVGAFYAGVGPSLVGIIPYAGFNLGAYDALRKAYQISAGTEAVPHGWSLIFGAVSGVSAATVCFPLEVVRRRMMMGSKYKNTVDAIVTISKDEGVGMLFKGCTLNWVKLAPAAGISFYVYEVAKEWLQVSKK